MDWLARLHPRAAQAPSAARPVLAPRFADAAPVRMVAPAEPVEDALHNASAVDGKAPRQTWPSDLGRDIAARPSTPADPRSPPLAMPLASPPTSSIGPAPFDANPSSPPEPLAARAAAPTTMAASALTVQQRSPAAAQPVVAVRQALPPRDGIQRLPLRRAAPHAASVSLQASPFGLPPGTPPPDQPLTQATRLTGAGDAPPPAQPLVVQVSIDRIEVRAPATTSPRKPTPARATSAASQGVSLSDYLRGGRNGGRS